MEQEEKKAAFLKTAQENKDNYDLHKRLIAKYIEFDYGDLKGASIEYFFENGKPTGGFLLALIAYAEEYHESKVKNFSSNSMLADSLPHDICKKCGEPLHFAMGSLFCPNPKC